MLNSTGSLGIDRTQKSQSTAAAANKKERKTERREGLHLMIQGGNLNKTLEVGGAWYHQTFPRIR